MAAVEAILNAPTDDIRECPAMDSAGARVVALNLETIFNKCLYCTRLRLPLPLEVLLSLVNNAGALQPERVCSGLLRTAEEGTCLDVFCELAAQLLSRKATALRLQFDAEVFFAVVQLFCSSAALKDRLGATLGETLLTYMQAAEMHADDYRVHRNCCSAIISLLRGSQVNKAHFGPQCGTVAACLEGSSDFFFQMQCVEVLYRLYKYKSTYLITLQVASASGPAPSPDAAAGGAVNVGGGRHGSVSGLPGIHPYLLRGIEELPDDSSLLLSIHQLLDSYNRDVHPDRVVAFPVLHMEVDGLEISRATTLYFSPLLLVVLLPGPTGGYLTIPYEHVRSVKLSREHKLELRLAVVPAKLALVMSLDEGSGRDKLVVSMTRATMGELRTSVVHQWVADRKRTAPRRIVQQPQRPPGGGGGNGGGAAPSGEEALVAAPLRQGGGATPPPSGSRPASHSRHGGIEVRPPNVDHRSRDKEASWGGGGRQSELSRSHSASRRDPTLSSSSHARGTHPGYDGAGDSSQGDDDAHAVLSEVHRAASAKAARYRTEQQAHVQHAVDAVKGELDELHRWSSRERDAYETHFREDMEVVRRSEAVLKESAAECVQALNAELDDVQALGGLLKAEVDKLRQRLAKSVGKSEGVEEAHLVRIKQTVDSSMREMEATLLSLSSAAATGQSMETVVQYIAKQMQAISSGAVTPGVRQREGGQPQPVKTRRLN